MLAEFMILEDDMTGNGSGLDFEDFEIDTDDV